MKFEVPCPACSGSKTLRADSGKTSNGFRYNFRCVSCAGYFSEKYLLEFMREQEGMDRNAPAFRVLDPKVRPKGKSEAARAVFA